MRTENEIKDKLSSMKRMLQNVKKDDSKVAMHLRDILESQIDILLWMLNDKSGLPPIDEDETYACYQ